MCWKYEKEYSNCMDHLFFPADDPEVLTMLEEWLGAKIDREKARKGFEEMLTKNIRLLTNP